jgi:CIC family chloride channel protein
VFTSLAVTGVFVGELVAQLLGRTESNFLPLLGGACFLGNGYRIPLAGMLLVAESTGELGLTVVGLAAVALGQVLMGDDSVSDAKHEARADALASAVPAADGIPGRERTRR